MFDTTASRRAFRTDLDLLRHVARPVVYPDAEITLERDRLPVERDRRPEHPAAREVRQPSLITAADRLGPEILWTPAVADEIDRRSIARPHRPLAFRAAVGDLSV